MSLLKLQIDDRSEQLRIALPDKKVILIGRDPNGTRLDPLLREELGGSPIELVTVSSPRVSANHLLVQQRGDQTKVRDLNSRNGSWIRLPPKNTASFDGDVELTLELARAAVGRFTDVSPEHADWSTDEGYAAAIVKVLSGWLERAGVQARVYTTMAERCPPDAMPLAEGSQLHIVPPTSGTFEVSWRSVIDSVRDYVNGENVRFEQLQGHDEDFILASPLMREVHGQIVDAAAYGMRLVILGPTGAGKERLARCFHRHSQQHRGPYATVNCALLKENLLYAQLFGAKRGSFTGAVQDVVGVLEAAHEGTLFLDEIGEMDLEVQKAMLRFLDSRGEYRRLGDSANRRANVQLVCATNVPLDSEAVRRGKFRDDLWYRLAVKVVQVPPICQRKEDILAFLKLRHLRGGHLRAFDALTPSALQMVLSDPWPGNFRDLENFVERLPPATQPRSLDENACMAALREGRGRELTESRASASFRSIPPLQKGSWHDVSGIANNAFEEDHGGPPVNWGQIQMYNEKYLKPVFIAHSCGLSDLNELNKSINYSGLARRLNIADGTTVKMHLSRYIERFRQRQIPSES